MLKHLHATTFLPWVGGLGGLVLNHLDGNRHAGLAYFGHMGMIHKVRRSGCHALRQSLVVLDDVVLLEDIQRRQRRRTGQRIAGVTV